jgi:hypothetical protein
MKIILFFILLIINLSCFGQDTLRIYFEFGSAKLDKNATLELSSLNAKYDFSNLDSVQFIGYSDSVGNLKSNLKLSKKRANNAYKNCKNSFDKNVKISLLAKGEGTHLDPQVNRRVELIFHFKKENIETVDEVIEMSDPRCFFIDYGALSLCHIRTIQEKKKKLIYIEAINDPLISDTVHYYLSKNTNGIITIKKIKWKKKQTGILWWKKSRLVTTIQEKEFNQYKIFTLGNPPCNGCKETIFTKDTVFVTKLNYYTDYFLMDNLQAKVKFFGKNKIKIRVPREYVDITKAYYAGTNVEWTSKRGKRHMNYYFANLVSRNGNIPLIKTLVPTIHCYNSGLPKERRFYCGGSYSSFGINFQLTVEPGIVYQNDTLTAFVTGGIAFNNERSNFNLHGGINSHLGFIGSAKYKFHFFTFPLASVSLGNSWETPSGVPYNFNNFGRFYLGSELRTSYNKNYMSFFESNLFAGLSFTNIKIDRLLSQVYVHGGIAKDFSNRVNTKFYAFAQVGIIFKLVNINLK